MDQGYKNKRAEMRDLMAEWIKAGDAIDRAGGRRTRRQVPIECGRVGESNTVEPTVECPVECPVESDAAECSVESDTVECPVESDAVECPVELDAVECPVESDTVEWP